MARTQVDLPGGAKVQVEGTPEEIEDIVRRLVGKPVSRRQGSRAQTEGARSSAPSIRDYVLELRESGLFSKPQGLSQVKEALAGEGHIIPITTLSGVMLAIVKAKELRRIRDQNVWKYVDR